MATKPASKPLWTETNPTVRIEPTGSKKEAGWAADERPPHEFFNWLFYNIGVEWLDYFEEVTDAVAGFTQIYNAFVGTIAPGGLATHASLNAVMADGGVPSNCNILVLDAATINTTQQITKNGARITFLPSAIYTKGSASIGLEIQADEVSIYNGRFEDYTTGDAIKILAAADYTQIRDTRFDNCASEINDLSSSSSISGTMTIT